MNRRFSTFVSSCAVVAGSRSTRHSVVKHGRVAKSALEISSLTTNHGLNGFLFSELRVEVSGFGDHRRRFYANGIQSNPKKVDDTESSPSPDSAPPPPPPDNPPTDHPSKSPFRTGLTTFSKPLLKKQASFAPFADVGAKEWVSRFSSSLIPGKNWLREEFLNRFLRFFSWFDSGFEKLSPETYKKYKSLSNGFQLFLKDIVRVTEMATTLHYQADYHFFKRRDLEVYLELPKDIKKVLPIMIIFSLPGGAIMTLPIVAAFPRYLLSSHFWTPEQRRNFAILDHKQRIAYYRTLLRKLKSCAVKKLQPGEMQTNVVTLVERIEKGETPTLDDLLLIEPYFRKAPFDLEYFSRSHNRALLRANDVKMVLLFQRNLYIEGRMLRAIDEALRVEGLDSLSDLDLEWTLFARGFNPEGLSREDRLTVLRGWLSITTKLDPRSIALYLHLPAMLFYNEERTKRDMVHVDIPDDH